MATLLWILSAAAALLAVALGAILAFHWFRYAMNPPLALIAILTYGAVCFSLILVLFAAATAYTL